MKNGTRTMALAMLVVAGLVLSGADAGPQATTQISAADLQMKKVEIAGTLGKPLGVFSRIEGVLELPTKSRLTMVVEKVDGEKLDVKLRVGVEGTTAGAGNRCVLRGYETMGVYGTPRDPEMPAPLRAVDQGNSEGMYAYDSWFQVTKTEAVGAVKAEKP